MESQLPVSEKYTSALAEQKHYDNLSLGVVTGIAIIPGAVFQLADGKAQLQSTGAGIVGVLMIGLLFLLYLRLSAFARTARNVSAAIEDGTFQEAGVSSVFISSESAYHAHRGGGTFAIVLALSIISCAATLLVPLSHTACS